MYNNVFKRLIDGLAKGDAYVLATSLSENNRNKKLYRANEQLPHDIGQAVRQALDSGKPILLDMPEKKLLEPFYPEPRLIIFGGGHIAKPLTEIGAMLGFAITIVDDRVDFANTSRFPQAETIICESFENSFQKLKLNEYTFIVIVTRGHKHDLTCLREAIKAPVAYLGMIGSQRKVQSIRQTLLKEGVSPAALDRVYAPIGLKIQAVSPEEITVAIMAEIIAVKNSTFKSTDCDKQVLKQLAEQKCDPHALVTILSAKGSVPRREGAKMVIFKNGNIIGSIGGGVIEAQASKLAQKVIVTGGHQFYHMDMTGTAEELGMICGGEVDLLIEAL